ncbi:unnamed protein product [Urochloa humidicola]
MLKQTGCAALFADLNWDNFAPVKVRVFFWILRHGNTRTRSFLHGHGALGASSCPFCYSPSEDIEHLFFTCPRLAAFWAFACPSVAPCSVPELAASLPFHERWLHNTTILLLLWVVWKSRNRMVFVFDNVNQDLTALNKMVIDHVKLWLSRAPQRMDCSALDLWCATLPV